MAGLVKDYMAPKNEVVSLDDSVESAIELMVENDAGSVIVQDDNQKVIGIFTERDLLRHCLENQSKFLYLKVSEVMTSPAITVSKESKVSDALHIMNERNIRRIPVVDKNGRLEGILSWKELFTHLFPKLSGRDD